MPHRSPQRVHCSDGAVLTIIRTVAETGSTNDDVKQLAAEGAPEGTWLRAERQTMGRGRGGRSWHSPAGNLYASTLVRLKPDDPPAPTLALVAGVALHGAVAPLLGSRGLGPRDTLLLKWPNDLLINARKLAGILLERVGSAVILGFGVNLAHHPDDQARPATSLSAEGCMAPPADVFAADLAHGFAAALGAWRSDGLQATIDAWLAAAHPPETALTTHGVSGEPVSGAFQGLEPDGALRLLLPGGGTEIIHAGDVFLV